MMFICLSFLSKVLTLMAEQVVEMGDKDGEGGASRSCQQCVERLQQTGAHECLRRMGGDWDGSVQRGLHSGGGEVGGVSSASAARASQAAREIQRLLALGDGEVSGGRADDHIGK